VKLNKFLGRRVLLERGLMEEGLNNKITKIISLHIL
jgi:hypothetical protein